MQQITSSYEDEGNQCAGCRKPIKDRFIFSVIDLNWHQDCVRCTDCQLKLIDQCYEIKGKLYCKSDYWRRYGPKCFACCKSIEKGELVQKVLEGNRVYHLKCFTCNKCHKVMSTGEQMHLVGGKRILCKQDFNQLQQQQAVNSINQSNSNSNNNNISSNNSNNNSNSNNSKQVNGSGNQSGGSVLVASNNNSNNQTNNTTIHNNSHFDERSESSDDLASDKLTGELADDDDLMGDDRESASQQDLNGLDEVGDDPNSNEKRRGPRTTIKPNQLNVLKQAFESAPKPSRHIREQLAEQTGLNMRVIQVWFQNRRSKERRMKNSNGSARRNFFRSSSRRLRAGASVAGTPPAPVTTLNPAGLSTPPSSNGLPAQSLMVGSGRNNSTGGGAQTTKQQKGQQRQQHQQIQQAQMSPQMTQLDSTPSQQQQGGGRGKHESSSEFGGSSSGGFTYFSDSSNQGDVFAMGTTNHPPNSTSITQQQPQYLTDGPPNSNGQPQADLLNLESPTSGQSNINGLNGNNGNNSRVVQQQQQQQQYGSPHSVIKHHHQTPPPPPQQQHMQMLGAGHSSPLAHGQSMMPPVGSHQLHTMSGHPQQLAHLTGNGAPGGGGGQLMSSSGGMMLGHPPVVQW